MVKKNRNSLRFFARATLGLRTVIRLGSPECLVEDITLKRKPKSYRLLCVVLFASTELKTVGAGT